MFDYEESEYLVKYGLKAKKIKAYSPRNAVSRLTHVMSNRIIETTTYEQAIALAGKVSPVYTVTGSEGKTWFIVR